MLAALLRTLRTSYRDYTGLARITYRWWVRPACRRLEWLWPAIEAIRRHEQQEHQAGYWGNRRNTYTEAERRQYTEAERSLGEARRDLWNA